MADCEVLDGFVEMDRHFRARATGEDGVAIPERCFHAAGNFRGAQDRVFRIHHKEGFSHAHGIVLDWKLLADDDLRGGNDFANRGGKNAEVVVTIAEALCVAVLEQQGGAVRRDMKGIACQSIST